VLLLLLILLLPFAVTECSVNKENIETMKRRWVDAGRPQFPDWDKLMAGLVAPEHVVKQKQQQ